MTSHSEPAPAPVAAPPPVKVWVVAWKIGSPIPFLSRMPKPGQQVRTFYLGRPGRGNSEAAISWLVDPTKATRFRSRAEAEQSILANLSTPRGVVVIQTTELELAIAAGRVAVLEDDGNPD